MLQKIILYFSPEHRVHHLKIIVSRFCKPAEKAMILKETESALCLIEKFAPEKFNALQKDVRVIFIHGLLGGPAYYVPDQRMVELNERDIAHSQMSAEWLACVLIHEAQHARLFRLGFGYEYPIRARIERICYRAQRNFARLLPNGQRLVAQAQAFLDADLEASYTKEGRLRVQLKDLEDMGCPAWVMRVLRWTARRRGLIAVSNSKSLDGTQTAVDG